MRDALLSLEKTSKIPNEVFSMKKILLISAIILVVLIGIAAIMGGLGLYVLLFEDGLIGLLLAAMCALPIAFFAWMLKLKRRS